MPSSAGDADACKDDAADDNDTNDNKWLKQKEK